MKTHSIAAEILGNPFSGISGHPAHRGLAAQVPGRSSRKRVSAMMRLACRVLGLKRPKGLGLALLGACGAFLFSGAPVLAANGIHINANTSGSCVSINDPQPNQNGMIDSTVATNLNFQDATSRCDATQNPDQKDYVLFFRPEGVSGVGATSLMLGGELHVNSGFIKLGDGSTGMRIGNASTTATNGGIAIGNGAASVNFGTTIGTEAKGIVDAASLARDSVSSPTAVGYRATANGPYSTALGAEASAAGDRASALGSHARATADSSTAVGYNAAASATNAFAAGINSVASANESVAIGNDARATHGVSVALGSGSRTRAFSAAAPVVLNGKTYSFDSTNLKGVVSLGSDTQTLQIINVAPGMINATSTDAVNGSQLFAAYDAINTLGVVDETHQAAIELAEVEIDAVRISQAAATASVAQAIGGGATVDAEGKVVMPTLALTSLGEGQPQPTTVLGAVGALDRSLQANAEALRTVTQVATEANDMASLATRQLQGFGPDETVAGRIDEVKRNSLMWDPGQGAYSANNASSGQNRISNLAEGQAETDAVNKGQLDQAIAQAKGQGDKLVQESGGQLLVGKDSAATAVNLAGVAPQRDANGNAVLDAEGKPVMTPLDRSVTGVAAGVNGNDAVNKGQLDSVAQAADAAQIAATGARQAAGAAQSTAAGAQRAADAAQGTATGAQQAAVAAQAAATGAQQAADAGNAKLAGIADGETVTGLIDQAKKGAVDAAGLAANQSLAAALGGNATVGADGKPGAPTYTLSQIGADGGVVAQGQTAANVGAALAAVDANVIKVNERVLAQDAKVGQLTQDVSDLRGDSLLWDADAGAFSAAHGGESPNRLVNLAAGQAATDAVNKGQLDTVAQAAESAQSDAAKAQQSAGVAQASAAGALQAAETAQGAATGAQQAAEAAQGTASAAQTAAGAAQTAAAGAQQTAEAAQRSATGAQQAAQAAQGSADQAQQSAQAAQGAAAGAQRSADTAQATAENALQAAATAQGTATGAQQSADVVRAKLAGIGEGETVAGRIDQATARATEAAREAAAQSLAAALGGNASVGADGKPGAPSYTVSQIGADGVVAPQGQMAANVGDALAALDANAIKVNDRVLAQDAKVVDLTQDLRDLRGDSLLWDEGAQAFSAAHGADSPNRIVNLAAGQAATDAINKSQLDQAVAELKAQGAGLLQESGGQLQVGKDSAATIVNLAGSAPQRDADGNPVLDAEGNAVMAPMDRQLTGVADGVNGNDAVNKGQLDTVAQAATDAQGAAAGAQRAAEAAQGTATSAQQVADAAQGTASGARQAADAAQLAATGAQQAADAANAKLAGIADGETVAGRIEQAAQAAADAAGRAAGQSLADALGGGSTVGADGKAGAPAYGISQIGADGTVAAQGQTAGNVGDAIAAVDANVIKVNDRVLAQDAKVVDLTQDLRDLRGDSLLWDEGAQAFSAAHGADSPNRIVNLAAGEAATDAVNKSQLDTVEQTADTAQSDAARAQQSANAAQESATRAQQTAQAAQGSATDAQQSADAANARLAGIGSGETVAGRIDQAAQAAGQALADALGGGAAVRADGTVQGPAYAVTAIGPGGSAQPQAPAGNVSDAIKAIDGSVVAVNDNVNKVGADVTTMRDQLNAGELGLVQQDGATRDITVARQADGARVTLDGAAGARTLSGVKAGEVSAASTEAVVGSQLFTVNQDLLKNSQAVGSLETLTGQQGETLSALSDLVDSGNVGLARHDPSSNAVSLAADRGGSTMDVSGADGVRQVTGVRDGRIQAGSTDAVTGGQMNAVAERINRLDAQGAGVAVDSRGDGSDRAVATPGSRGVAVGANAQATGANSVATGAGSSAQGAGSSAMGAGASAQAAGSTAVGANAKASAPGSVAIGEGAQATRANTVSVGSAGAERQITHVAPATQDTDAVNLRQATGISRQEAGRALDQANRYTDSRIGELRSDTNAGIASAMAMATMPSAVTPGKSMFSLGTALYNGQSAIAMGLSGRSQNGAWAYRASSSSTTDGDVGAAVGVGYEW